MIGNTDLADEIDTVPSTPISVEKESVLFSAGYACPGFLWIDRGVIRVQITLASGREVTLYRLEPGDACLLTTSCLFGADRYFAEGVAETQIAGRLLLAGDFHALIARSSAFRAHVLNTMGQRFKRLLERIESIGGHRIDHELAKVLLAGCASDGVVRTTHVELARELGSAREVISRKLKTWEQGNKVELGRNVVVIKDQSFIEALATVESS